MKPPLPHSESAVPRTLHAQLEIAKAMCMLTAPDDDEPLRRRRAELAAIRGELEAMKLDLHKAGEECLALVMADLRTMLAKKYNSNQPRVPAGNRDGGQWTDGSEVGGETSSDHSDDGAGDARSSPIRYAQAGANTATDDTSGGSNVAVTTLEDTQHDLSNLYHASVTAAHSLLGSAFRYFFDSHYFDIKIIAADEIPTGNPRQPVPFVDSNGDPVVVDGNPLLRPTSLPPEMYAQAGLAVRSWANTLVGLKQEAMPDDPDVANAQSIALAEVASKILLPLAPGGPLDAERFDWTYVRDYRHYQNIMIGVYGAAAGMSGEDVLSLVDLYAAIVSHFRAKEFLDEVYTHSARQDVEDTKLGYALYQSGRIRLRN
jgi:hypothetical protein